MQKMRNNGLYKVAVRQKCRAVRLRAALVMWTPRLFKTLQLAYQAKAQLNEKRVKILKRQVLWETNGCSSRYLSQISVLWCSARCFPQSEQPIVSTARRHDRKTVSSTTCVRRRCCKHCYPGTNNMSVRRGRRGFSALIQGPCIHSRPEYRKNELYDLQFTDCYHPHVCCIARHSWRDCLHDDPVSCSMVLILDLHCIFVCLWCLCSVTHSLDLNTSL